MKDVALVTCAVCIVILVVLLVRAAPEHRATSAAPAPQQAADARVETPQQKASYSVGLDVGSTLRREGPELETGAFYRGLRDGLSGAEPLLPQEEVQELLRRTTTEARDRAAERARQQADVKASEAAKFLADNAQRPGVHATASGLQYEVLTEGTGPTPGPTSTVVVHYRGTLLDGREFDSSYKRNEPATFAVGGVIDGWTEALQLMKVGSKWKLFIQPELAYGRRGSPPQIGPNELLIFEVELLEVKEPSRRREGA